ncbi:MAG: cytochrome c [Nitrospiraceae bacterium]|nr:MAG: cytochrome c [Nitrospiraceae bacterium]
MKEAIFFFLILIGAIGFIALANAQGNTSLSDAEKIYRQYCSSCHGDRGDGNGFNAKNLDPRPANHTDQLFMSKRTDHELFEAISGGGRAIGRAAVMPPWGNTLDSSQITSLVRYLRRVCRCEGDQ